MLDTPTITDTQPIVGLTYTIEIPFFRSSIGFRARCTVSRVEGDMLYTEWDNGMTLRQPLRGNMIFTAEQMAELRSLSEEPPPAPGKRSWWDRLARTRQSE